MKSALIILNYNAYHDLVGLVNQLLISIEIEKYLIIVLDNKSSKDKDELDVYFHSKNALVINGLANVKPESIDNNEKLIYIKLKENYGYSYGNNVGLKLAYKLGSNFGFIINPDVSIPDSLIFDDAISIFTTNKKIGVLGYRVILPNGNNQGPFKYKLDWVYILRNFFFPIIDIIKTIYWYFQKQIYGIIYVPAVVGCFVGFDLRLMDKVGYYDENVFLYYEEYIISERMRKDGFKTAYSENYFVNHNHVYENENKTVEEIKKDEKSKNYYLKEYLKLSSFSINIMQLSIRYYRALKLLFNIFKLK
jgi:hypothetical protein